MSTNLPIYNENHNIWTTLNNYFYTLNGSNEYINLELNGNNPPTVKQYSRFQFYKTSVQNIPNEATGNNEYSPGASINYLTNEAIFENSSDRAFTWGSGDFPSISDGTWYLYCKGSLNTDSTTIGKGDYTAKQNTPTFNIQKGGWYYNDGSYDYKAIAKFIVTSSVVSNLIIYEFMRIKSENVLPDITPPAKGIIYIVGGAVYISLNTTSVNDWSLLNASITATSTISGLNERLESAELKNLEQEIRLGYLENRNYVPENTYIELFVNNDNLRNKFDYNVNNTCEIMDDDHYHNNWKYRENEKPNFKNGFIRQQKKMYKGQMMEIFNLQNVGQKVSGSMSRYDSVNNCYWMISNQIPATNSISEITKISKYMEKGKISVLGRWYINRPNGSQAEYFTGIDVTNDGNFLLVTLTNNSATYNWSGVGKLPINSDGTIGVNNTQSENYLTWVDLGSWTSSSDFQAVNDLDRVANGSYYPDLVVWNTTEFALLKTEDANSSSSGHFDVSLEFFQIADNGSGAFLASTRTPITKLEKYLTYDFNTDTAQEYSSLTCTKDSSDNFYIKCNLYSENYRYIHKFNVADNTSSYIGDITGSITGSPEVTTSSERFEVFRNIDPYTAGSSGVCKEGISISSDNHLLEIVNEDVTPYKKYLYKRALTNAYKAENIIEKSLHIGSNAYASPYVQPNVPYDIFVEVTGGETYYWLADTSVTANEVDVYRFKISDNTYKHARLIGASWTSCLSMTNKSDNLYLLGRDSAGNGEVYFGSLATFISSMGSTYSITNTIDITTWGTLSSGIGASDTDLKLGICYRSSNDTLYIVNDTNDKIDTLSSDGTTYNKGVIDLPASGNQWRGITIKNELIVVCDFKNTANHPNNYYEIDPDLSTSSKMYVTHIYQDPAMRYQALGSCGCEYDGNILLTYNIGDYRISGISSLHDPDALQLESFMTEYNILLSDDVRKNTDIIKRTYEPEKFLDQRCIPDLYYCVVGYEGVNAGISILNLDEYLISKDNLTSSGLRRYDVRKIKPMHFKCSESTAINSISMLGGTGTGYITELEVEMDMIFVAVSYSTSKCFVIDLVNNQSILLSNDTNTGKIYAGGIHERNDSLGYSSTYNENLQVSSFNIYGMSIRTFTKDDDSDYKGQNPITFVALATENSGCDIIKITYNDTSRAISRIYKNIFNSGTYNYSAIWIAPSGKIVSGAWNSSGNILHTLKPIWEISEDNEFLTSDINKVRIFQGTDIGNNGYNVQISKSSIAYKLANGIWRHFIYVTGWEDGSGNGKQGMAFIDIENEKNIQHINIDGRNYEGYHGLENYEDVSMLTKICNFSAGYLEHIEIVKRAYFDTHDITLDLSRAINLYMENDYVHYYGYQIYDISKPLHHPGLTAIDGSGSTLPYSNPNISYSKIFKCFFSGSKKGLIFFFQNNQDENVCESINTDLSYNPKSVNYKKSSIEPSIEILESIEVNDSAVTYVNGASETWTTSSYEASIDADTVTEGYAKWNIPSGFCNASIRLEYSSAKGRLILNHYNKSDSITRSGDITTSSPVIQNLSTTSDLNVGDYIFGTGIPDNSKILSIDSSSQITITKNATSTTTTSLTFYPVILNNELVDCYKTNILVDEEDRNFHFEIESDKEYLVTILHNGDKNASSSGTTITIHGYFLYTMESSNITTNLIVYHSDHSEEKTITLSDNNNVNIVDSQTFNGTGSQTEFTLSGTNRAYSINRVSPDNGSTYYLNGDTDNFSWGTNSPNYDNNLIDSSGFTTVKFVSPPGSGTGNVIIEYFIKNNSYRVKRIFNNPYNSGYTYKDDRIDIRLLDDSTDMLK